MSLGQSIICGGIYISFSYYPDVPFAGSVLKNLGNDKLMSGFLGELGSVITSRALALRERKCRVHKRSRLQHNWS